mgnify:CR=1 FL=1
MFGGIDGTISKLPVCAFMFLTGHTITIIDTHTKKSVILKNQEAMILSCSQLGSNDQFHFTLHHDLKGTPELGFFQDVSAMRVDSIFTDHQALRNPVTVKPH